MGGPGLDLDGLDLEVQPDQGEHETLQVLEDEAECKEVKNRVEVGEGEESEERERRASSEERAVRRVMREEGVTCTR